MPYIDMGRILREKERTARKARELKGSRTASSCAWLKWEPRRVAGARQAHRTAEASRGVTSGITGRTHNRRMTMNRRMARKWKMYYEDHFIRMLSYAIGSATEGRMEDARVFAEWARESRERGAFANE